MQSFSLRALAVAGALSVVPSLASAQTTARYRVTFDATWSQQSHPAAFVSSAHFSPLIGASHSDALVLWEPGGLATNGIEQMAETGATSILSQEINAHIAGGTALERIQGGPVGISPGTASATLEVNAEFPLVSLVTMIAPSPDWFVGVHGLSLLENGQWVDGLEVPLLAYDAGTDSGLGLVSPNQNTNPAEPISLLTSGPFFGTTPLGTFRFERLSSSLVYGDLNPAGSIALQAGTPELGQQLTIALDDPTGSFPTSAPTLLAIAGAPDAAFPGGTLLPNLGLGPIGTAGELLVGGTFAIQAGPVWDGTPATIALAVPTTPSLAGVDVYLQGALIDPVGLRSGLTQGLELRLGS